MSNPTLNILLKDYEKKKYYAELKFERDKEIFYSSHPDLEDLNKKLGAIALEISKAILNNNTNLSDKLKLDFNNLKLKKENLLKSIEIPQGILEPIYECSICKDSAFITNSQGKSILCNCIKQKLFDIDFNKSNIRKSRKREF